MKRYILTFVVIIVAAAIASPSVLQAATIPVPNGDFNDNSDGDILAVDAWSDNDNQGADEVQQVENAVGKAAGDLVMIAGFKFDFANPTVAVGVNFDSSVAAYVLSLEARAFNDIDLQDVAGAAEDDWGFLFRDMTNGNNIKTASQPNPIDGDSWQTLSLELTQAEMLQYEIDNGVDIDAAEIGVRIFKNGGSADFVAVDNVTITVVPEPGSAVLVAALVGAVGATRRRVG